MIPVKGARVPTRGILSFHYQRSDTHKHQGVDLVAPLGSPVVAAEGGTVLKTIDSYTPGYRGYGKTVVVWSPVSSRYYLYAHLNSISVQQGAKVATGDLLGTVGYTAYRTKENEDLKSKAAHLHFEVSDSPYPKPSEQPRLNPVAVLRSLDASPGNAGSVTVAALVLLALLALVYAYSS